MRIQSWIDLCLSDGADDGGDGGGAAVGAEPSGLIYQCFHQDH